MIFIKDAAPALGQTRAMQRFVHTLTCMFLALAMALAGPGIVGPVKGATLVALCADGSADRMWLDAEGNPTTPDRAHARCLDCLLFSAPLPDAADGCLSIDQSGITPDLPLPAPILLRVYAHLRPDPRGPPTPANDAMRFGYPCADTRFLGLLAQPPLDCPQATRLIRVTDLRVRL